MKQIRKHLPTFVSRSHWSVRGISACLCLALLAGCKDSPTGPKTGSLVVNVAGLPVEAQNAVSVRGPQGSGYSRVLNGTETLSNLAPGAYTVQANVASTSSGSYTPEVPSQQVNVVASTTPAEVSVVYTITTGSIAFTVAGLPAGTSGSIVINGPEGYRRDITESVTLTHLAPGSYTTSSSSVQASNGHVYSPTPFAQALTLAASESPRNLTTTYALSTGALQVSVNGLPTGAAADVLVTGPSGFNRTVSGTATIIGLFPGTYSVTASDVFASGKTFAPQPATQPLQVSPSLTPVNATVTYSEANAPPPPSFNLTIDGMYITQAVQDYAAHVPLIAGMPGLVRVFVKASDANTVHPHVRVRLFNGSTLVQTITVQPNTPGVPTTITEGNLFSTWNAIVPAFAIQPGLRMVADVDPTNTVPELNEDDNGFPVNGNPVDVPVEFTTPLNVTFVPVFQSSTGLTGDVTSQNAEEFLTFARKVLPIKDYSFTIHSPFTTSAPPLESNNGNGAWITILGEMNTLRVAEGSSNYYMGIVGTTYTSGVAGFGFAPGRAAVAWDKLPNAASIFAHELGHNLSRLHAPCGGAGSPDAAFPYPLGNIGVWGYDIAIGQLKAPVTSDLMGYCGFGWISDYNYKGILDYRRTNPGSSVSPNVAGGNVVSERFVQSNTTRPSLVVWGRIVDGQPVLEPAFTATTRPVLPSRAGPYRIEAVDANGIVVFAHDFDGEVIADVPNNDVRQFAFAIPIDAVALQSIARLRLSTNVGSVSEQALLGAAAPSATAIDATITGPGEVSFRVRDASVRLAVIRERSTQRIVAFARGQGPTVIVRSPGTDFDVQLSDGVRSTGRALRAVRR